MASPKSVNLGIDVTMTIVSYIEGGLYTSRRTAPGRPEN
jgi:hypothetical protein